MIRPIDLHNHSTRSDGTFTPTELVKHAREKKLLAFALTDHDTTDGIEEAMNAAASMKQLDPDTPEVVPGVELSTDYNGKDIHIVGLFPDWDTPAFKEEIKNFADARVYRNQKMCRLLQADGYDVEYEKVLALHPDTVLARPHFAQYMMDKGIVSSIQQAFDEFIGDGCPYFVPREKITPQKAVQFLLKFHGVPILAHPLHYKLSDEDLEVLVTTLCEVGLLGIEVYYNNHTPADTEHIAQIAQQHGLLPSGGSDFHGTRKPGIDMGTGYGNLFVPETILPPIREASERLRSGT